MRSLQVLIKKCALKTLYGGRCPSLTKLSSNYKKKFGIEFYPFAYSGNISKEEGMKIADIYETLEHLPNNRIVRYAYHQLALEVRNQFEFIIENEKIEFEPYHGLGEPYSDSYDMLTDIHNHHLYFFKTESGFGEGLYTESNIMLNKTGIQIGDYELLINDVFRIVHDIFGHAMNGYGFGPIGEDKAWYTHLKMFSPMAAAALTTETRGQNCWVNFGAHLRDKNNQLYTKESPHYLSPSERPFASQKMNLLPSNISGIVVYEKDNIVKAKYLDIWDPMKGPMTT